MNLLLNPVPSLSQVAATAVSERRAGVCGDAPSGKARAHLRPSDQHLFEPRDEVPRTGEVNFQVIRLETACENMVNLLTELEKRLQPVLGHERGEGSTCSDPTKAPTSPLANRLSDLASRFEGVVTYVQMLNARTEV